MVWNLVGSGSTIFYGSTKIIWIHPGALIQFPRCHWANEKQQRSNLSIDKKTLNSMQVSPPPSPIWLRAGAKKENPGNQFERSRPSLWAVHIESGYIYTFTPTKRGGAEMCTVQTVQWPWFPVSTFSKNSLQILKWCKQSFETDSGPTFPAEGTKYVCTVHLGGYALLFLDSLSLFVHCTWVYYPKRPCAQSRFFRTPYSLYCGFQERVIWKGEGKPLTHLSA